MCRYCVEMTKLSPQDSGTGSWIHVFEDFNGTARHGPRIRVYPGRQSQGNEVFISVPTHEGEQPQVVAGDRSHFEERALARVLEFVALNREALLRHWNDDQYSGKALLHDVKPVG